MGVARAYQVELCLPITIGNTNHAISDPLYNNGTSLSGITYCLNYTESHTGIVTYSSGYLIKSMNVREQATTGLSGEEAVVWWQARMTAVSVM